MRPLAIDLFCGLSGWGAGLIAEGWRVIGYDIEDMFEITGEPKPEHFSLVLQDARTIRGAQLCGADLIVSSSPCTEYSWMAMPWSRAKQVGRALRGEDEFPDNYKGSRTIEQLNELFNTQFRIQRECNEARATAGLPPIPMVCENVRGAQPWVGRAKWNFGSFYLFGDVPLIMPRVRGGGGRARQKSHEGEQWNINRANFTGTLGWDQSERAEDGRKNPGFRFDGSGRSFQTESVERHVTPDDGFKTKGMDWSNRNLRGQDFTRIAGQQAMVAEGLKGSEGYDRDHPAAFGWKKPGTSSNSPARKAASAKIAKIPFALSSHIARVFHPDSEPVWMMPKQLRLFEMED